MRKNSQHGVLGPISTIALAIYLLSEPFTLWLVLGVALMMVGVMNLIRGSKKVARLEVQR